MGNWRRVWIRGTIPEASLDAVEKFFTHDREYRNFNCLSMGDGLCGLSHWVKTEVNSIGNLAERDYSVNDIKEVLEELEKKVPHCNVELTIHAGADYESDDCISTIIMKDGVVTINPPEIKVMPPITDEQIQGNFLKIFFKKDDR